LETQPESMTRIVLGATNMGIPFRVPIITILGLAHYRGGPAQGLDKIEPALLYRLGDEDRQLQYVFD
jgi:hypothetical protein